MPAPGSLRDYIEALRREGELHEVNVPVDWNLEVGAIIRRVNELRGPAVLFNSIAGYPPGFRILGSPVGASRRPGQLYARMALSLGLPPDTGAAHITELLSHVKDVPRLPPRLVSTGPVKQNVLTGEDVNVLRLPAPYLHQDDGGRYLGTWHVVVTKTPDGSWVNWGMYRIMVHDEKTLGGLVVPTQHIGMHLQEWRRLGKPMPFAIVLGTDSVTPLVASMAIPDNVSEPDIIGGLRGEALDVVRCETVSLDVPAAAEAVIEGYVSTDETRSEGPFGEYTGYMTPGSREQPVFHVTAIAHRDAPVLPVVCPGEPIDDHICMSLSLAADALATLRVRGLPVVMTHIPAVAALHLLVVAVRPNQFGGQDLARAVGEAIWSTKIGTLLPKIVLVDADIDATDLNSVIWSFATKCHPGRGHVAMAEHEVFPLSPYLSSDERARRRCTGMVYDCTFPSDWTSAMAPKRVSLSTLWPDHIREAVRSRWREYGFTSHDLNTTDLVRSPEAP